MNISVKPEKEMIKEPCKECGKEQSSLCALTCDLGLLIALMNTEV